MTPHIEAKKGEIAKTVIMPGDPLRAKLIAETYLEDYKQINQVRGMLGFTGFYKGKLVTVMASGMGIASMGIYSYELFKFYDVDHIIRVGSIGAYTDQLDLYDVVLPSEVYSDSNYAETYNGDQRKIIAGSKVLNDLIKKVASEKEIDIHEGRIYCGENFYTEVIDPRTMFEQKECVGVEMESFALFHNAHSLKKQAACLLTVSNNFITDEETTAFERQNSFKEMLELALEVVSSL